VYEDLRALWARAGDKAGGRRSSASLWRSTRVPAVEFLTRRSSTCRTPMIEFEWPALSAAFYQTMHCRPTIPDVMLSFSELGAIMGSVDHGSRYQQRSTNNGAR
jgi:hypothetical protein